MSELRHRRGERGESTGSGALKGSMDGNLDADKEEVSQEFTQEMVMDQVTKWLENCKEEEPVPGLCDAEKKCKDELAQDPYNLDKMLALGQEYGKAKHWDQCGNVLIRGWKRVDEFRTPAERLDYLWCLVEASVNCSKYQQALAVMNDVDEHLMEEDELRLFQMLKCQVFAGVNDKAGALKAFSRLVEGLELHEMARIWIFLSTDLKKVDLTETTRISLESKLSSEEDKKLLSVMQSLMELRQEALALKEEELHPDRWKMRFFRNSLLVVIIVFLFSLYYLEQENLKLLRKR